MIAIDNGTVGIYLVMHYHSRSGTTVVLSCYEDINQAHDHVDALKKKGLRTGDKVWVGESVLHLAPRSNSKPEPV